MRAVRHFVALILAAFAAPAAMAGQDQAQPDVTVAGVITGKDAMTYREVPFDVPAGVERITVALSYDKSNKTVIDLGLWDPRQFRGWSGGSYDKITVAASDATPGYLPGPIPTGRWHVQFGVPNARPDSKAAYTVKVYFDRGTSARASAAIANPPLVDKPGWYRGDLHMHDANSDGSCKSQLGRKVPCPLFRTVEAASASGLDFIAVTDHNTVAHFDNLRELQPWFDKMLLIPGVEVTTFRGHTNIFGPSRFVDFRVGTPGVPNLPSLQKSIADAGAIMSINHPASPSGEICMGCGWLWADTDWSLVTAVEAVNGTHVEGPYAGLGFWYARLNEGKRLTGIGGSDTHDPDGPSRIGRPTTVVYADSLSVPGITGGIKRGNVFIDTEGTRDRLLEIAVLSGGRRAVMGERLRPEATLWMELHLIAVRGASVEVVANGKVLDGLGSTIDSGDARVKLSIDRAQACGWISANVRGKAGLLLIGNPIYVDCR